MSPNTIKQLQQARRLLENGELVAIPTETVYGLAANAFSDEAIQKIYDLKNRPATNPLIVHIAELSVLDKIAKNIPDIAYRLANEFWPGPLTLVLEKQDHISIKLTAGLNTVGIRVPDHPLTYELLKSLKFPLVAPSANRSNHISPTKPEHVKISFGDQAPFILEGDQTVQGIESTIIGFNTDHPVIYRHGAISQEQIERFLGMEIESIQSENKLLAPGMMKKHYSPSIPLILTDYMEEEIKNHGNVKIGLLLARSAKELEKRFPSKVLSSTGDLHESMTNLYDHLYQLEQMNLELIIAEKVDNNGVGIAINDKLIRASEAG